MIIIGHSNAGKSPLGQTLQQRGFPPFRNCHHFDFGQNLREIAGGTSCISLPKNDIDYIRSILDGRLFDDAHQQLAISIIEQFLFSRSFNRKADLLILNGFPRHTGQAEILQETGFAIRKIIWLNCPLPEAYTRKKLAEKGVGHEDRGNRGDSAHGIFRRKIISFERQTRPLLSYYQRKKIPVFRLPVYRNTTPEDMYRHLSRETI